jgi:putative PIN family toxin of toxin-antitoxin system
LTTITIDSNVYISALVFGGLPREFLDTVRKQRNTFHATSRDLIEELEGVLREKFKWSGQMIATHTEALRQFSTVVTTTQHLKVIRNDPDDDRVLECALASGSKFIVTGDRDLLQLESYRGIRILRLAEFMDLLGLR